jgi:Periplasmic binding protein
LRGLRWAALSCLPVVALALGACGGGGGGGQAPPQVEDAAPVGQPTQLDLTIGDIVPLTGDLADFGPPARKAADLAIDEIEQATEDADADHTVNILHEDGQTNPQAGVQAGRRLTGDGASCLAGAWAVRYRLANRYRRSLRPPRVTKSPRSRTRASSIGRSRRMRFRATRSPTWSSRSSAEPRARW